MGDRLVRAREAIIAERKLRDYALNPDHPDGGPKARVFVSVLDIDRDNWRHLRDELLRALPGGRVDRINSGTTPRPTASDWRFGDATIERLG